MPTAVLVNQDGHVPGDQAGSPEGLCLYKKALTETSRTYFWGKTPLEGLVERWLKSSIKDSESALILGRYGVHGAFLELLY